MLVKLWKPLSGMCVLLLVTSIVLFALMQPAHSSLAAATPNPNCTLIVPAHALSAKGLATPYKLISTSGGSCSESNMAQRAFVQATIYDPTLGTFSVYNPLVIDRGTTPAVVPTAPVLATGSVVALWFGFNGNNLRLRGARDNTLSSAHCVNGLGHSLFGQFSSCNASAFFARVNQGIVAGLVHIPALGTALDGQPCPTVRDFSVVDQDQSDNVQSQYLVTVGGRSAQFSASNQGLLPGASVVSNPSDNRLLTSFIDPALGCTPWMAPNLADANAPVSSLALDELQASMLQAAPVALIPLTDPMTLRNGNASLAKTNLYRQAVDQIRAVTVDQASGTTYCQNMVTTGIPRLVLDKPFTAVAPSVDAGMANSLYTFLALRFSQSYVNLGCADLLGVANPVTLTVDANGIVVAATL